MSDLLAAEFFLHRATWVLHEDAEDLTQDFFVRILKERLASEADPTRGVSFSSSSRVQNFLNDAVDKIVARKRGGHSFISWDSWMTAAPSQLSSFERGAEFLVCRTTLRRGWAATIVQRALPASRGMRAQGSLHGFRGAESVCERGAGGSLLRHVLGEKLRVPEATVKKLLYRSGNAIAFCCVRSSNGADPAEVDELTTAHSRRVPPKGATLDFCGY